MAPTLHGSNQPDFDVGEDSFVVDDDDGAGHRGAGATSCEEVGSAFRRLYTVLKDGGESRSYNTGGKITVDDYVIVLEDTLARRHDGNLLTLVKLAGSWAEFMKNPTDARGAESKFAEERACWALFKEGLEYIYNGEDYRCPTITGDLLSGVDLLKIASNVSKENLITLEGMLTDCEHTYATYGPTPMSEDVLSTIGSARGSLVDAAERLSSYVLVMGETISANMKHKCTTRQTWDKMGSLAKFITSESKESSSGKDALAETTLFHAKKISHYMFINHIRRYQVTSWKQPTNKESSIRSINAIDEVMECGGLYRQLEVAKRPQTVLFDTHLNMIVGLTSHYYNRDLTRTDRAFPRDYDAGRVILGVLCTGVHTNDSAQRIFPCGSGLCCDHMHTKARDQSTRWKANGGKWRNPLEVDLSKLSLESNGHCFAPQMEPVDVSVRTNGFKKWGSLDDFFNWWFSTENNPRGAVDTLQYPNLLNRLKDYFTKTDLSAELTLKPNPHLYMFADGYLVVDPKLVEIPEFHRFDSHCFQPNGKFSALYTLMVREHEVFRGDEYLRIVEQCSSKHIVDIPIPGTGTTRNCEVCEVCSLPGNLCEDWQREFGSRFDGTDNHAIDVTFSVSEGGVTVERCCRVKSQTVSMLEVCRKVAEMNELSEDCVKTNIVRQTSMRLHEKYNRHITECTSAANHCIIEKHRIGKHRPVLFRSPTRKEAAALCESLDMGVLDDLIMYQYDYMFPWMDLPESLRVDAPDDRFWNDQLGRVRNELAMQLGRMFFRHGEFATLTGQGDKTQNMLGVIGPGNTGKSTLLNMYKGFIAAGDVGVLDSSTFEGQFGLSQVIDKQLCVINEVKTDSMTLTADLLKQMCDQSIMSAPVKNKDVKKSAMQGHIFFLGNERLVSTDQGGALSRRQLQMSWNREVPRNMCDPQIEAKFRTFAGHSLVVMHLKYWEMMEKHSGTDIWGGVHGGTYSYMSWIWHNARERSETTSSKVTEITRKFQRSPQKWKFASVESVSNFEVPVTFYDETQECYMLKYDADNRVNADWWDYDGQFDANCSSRCLPMVYMPLESIDPNVTTHKSTSFIDEYTDRLRSLNPGQRPKASDSKWDKGSDFYYKPFKECGIRVLEDSSLPWPPWSDATVNAKWVIGCVTKQVFANSQEGEGDAMWDAYRARRFD
jgi:hypothetical protein